MSNGGKGLVTRFRENTRGLDVIQSVYAFAMALGLTNVFMGSKTFLNDVIFRSNPILEPRVLMTAFLFANVVLLGLRFFWVPRNLGDLVQVAARCAAAQGESHPDRMQISNLSVALHLLMIFAHGTVFFLICTEFEYVAFLASSSLPLDVSMFTGYVILHVVLLLLNAGWIGATKLQEDKLERSARAEDDDAPSAGSVWWLNNLICSLVGIAPFALLGACQSEIGRCLANSNQLGGSMLNPGPLSPHQITEALSPLMSAAAALDISVKDATLYWVLAVLVFNSAFDLLTTGRHYLIFNDVEWERSVDPATRPAAE